MSTDRYPRWGPSSHSLRTGSHKLINLILVAIFGMVLTGAQSSEQMKAALELRWKDDDYHLELCSVKYVPELSSFIGVGYMSHKEFQDFEDPTRVPVVLKFDEEELKWARSLSFDTGDLNATGISISASHAAATFTNHAEEVNLVVMSLEDSPDPKTYMSTSGIGQVHSLASGSSSFFLLPPAKDCNESSPFYLQFRQFLTRKQLNAIKVEIMSHFKASSSFFHPLEDDSILFLSLEEGTKLSLIKVSNDSLSLEYHFQVENITIDPLSFDEGNCFKISTFKTPNQESLIFASLTLASEEFMRMTQAVIRKEGQTHNHSITLKQFKSSLQADILDIIQVSADEAHLLTKDSEQLSLAHFDLSNIVCKTYQVTRGQILSAALFLLNRKDYPQASIFSLMIKAPQATGIIILSDIASLGLFSVLSLERFTLLRARDDRSSPKILSTPVTLHMAMSPKIQDVTRLIDFQGRKPVRNNSKRQFIPGKIKRNLELITQEESLDQFHRQLQSFPATLVDQNVPYFIKTTYTIKISPTSIPITKIHTLDYYQNGVSVSQPPEINLIDDPLFKAPKYEFLATSYPQPDTILTFCIHYQDDARERQNFTVNFIETAPFLSTSPADMTIMIGNTAVQTLYPVDAEGNTFTVTVTVDGSIVLSPLASFDSATNKITFSPTLTSEIGTHTVDVALDDGMMDYVDTFVVTVIQPPPPAAPPATPPYYKSSLANQVVQLNSNLQYVLPAAFDDEGGIITVTVTSATASAFMIFTAVDMTVRFNPTLFSQVKTHPVIVTLKDVSALTKTYKFTVQVTNTAPKFQVTTLPNVSIYHNIKSKYTFPSSTDLEGNTIFAVQQTVYPWITSISTAGFTMLTSSTDFSMIGKNVVTVRLYDGQPLSRYYSFTVDILNRQPVFTTTVPQDQKVSLNQLKSFTLPPYHDPENHIVTVTLQGNANALSFTKLEADQKTITCNPTSFKLMGQHVIEVVLNDGQPLYSYYKFIINVTNTPPRFAFSQPQSQIVVLNSVKQYDLPLMVDDEGHDIEVVVKVRPNFATLVGRTFFFSPTQSSQLRRYEIQGQLKDEMNFTEFRFNVTVVNLPPYFEKNLENQTAIVGGRTVYTLPKTADREKLKVTVMPLWNSSEVLPKYVTFEGQSFIMSPLQEHLNDHVRIDVVLMDSLDQINLNYSFTIDVVNASYLQNSLSSKGSNSQKIVRARIALLRATADGYLKFKLKSKEGDVGLLVQKITNKSFRLTIPELNSTEVKYSVFKRDSSTASVVLKLYYPNAKNISTTQVLDNLELFTFEDLIHPDNQLIKILPQGLIYQTPIPPQVSDCKSQFRCMIYSIQEIQ